MTGPFSSLGAVDGFGLRTIYEVQQLVYVPIVDGTSHHGVRVLALRQLLLTSGQTCAELLSDFSIVTARRCSRRLSLRK